MTVPLAPVALACLAVGVASLGRAAGVARSRRRLSAGVGCPRVAAAARARDAARRFTRPASAGDLAEVVDDLARALRVGMPPAEALRAAQLERVAGAVEQGMPLAAALDAWAASGGAPPGADLVAAAVAVTAGAGGDPGRALAAVADTLRERRSLGREVRALSSQARLSAAVLAVAPVGFALVAAVTDATTGRILFGSPLGLACLAAGVALDVAGWWWMDRITRTVA